MKNVKNNKGITLMALVITIILLIILASIGIYSGRQVVKSAQFTAFSTELKIMQTQVNSLYEKKKNNEKILLNNVETDIEDIGTAISSGSEAQTLIALGITDTSDYKYFDTDTIKSLNIEGVEGEFFVNIDKRSVVSYDGFEYEGKTYYTLEQLPDGLYNVEHNTSEQQPDFNVDYELLENGKCKISVNNINYNGNINKWQVKYKKENEEDWKQSNNYSFIIDELGNYRVKIANNNVESNEKQIMARNLPSEYQQVEYIESTGTEYIDTGIIPTINTGININYSYSDISDSTSAGLCGIYQPNNPRTDTLFISTESGKTNSQIELISRGVYYNTNMIPTLNTKYNVKINWFNNNKLDFNNGQNITDNGTNSIVSKGIILFGREYNNSYSYTKARIYGCKFSEGTTVIREYIPCYRKSDNKPGLYDLVNDEFYTNQGTGDFIKGDDVIADNTNDGMIIIVNDM